SFVFSHFGWKGFLASVISTSLVLFRFRKEISSLSTGSRVPEQLKTPIWIQGLHLLFLGFVVCNSHHAILFIGGFLFFLGLFTVTKEYQDELKLREVLLDRFFLGGLVILGGLQNWCLEPLLQKLNDLNLFIGSTLLTAVMDNAALTYL